MPDNNKPTLTHLNESGEAHMVDISSKNITERSAIAEGTIFIKNEAMQLLLDGDVPKGDVLATARIAGIMAAKKTSDIIPLCHPLSLTKVTIDFTHNWQEHPTQYLRATCLARTTGKTGVEMEALTGVSVACLTIYDMLKAVDKSISYQVNLLEKSGGKSGNWQKDNVSAPELKNIDKL